MLKILSVFLASVMASTSSESLLKENKYHNYEEMTNFLTKFASLNYNVVKLYTIGRSYQNRELWVLEISGGNNKFLRPNIKLIGNIHGNEPVGVEVLLHFAEYLVEQYRGGDKRVTSLLDYARVHILPSMNPDGLSVALNRSEPGTLVSCSAGPGRNNLLDFNLNRNFPDHFRSNSQPLQLETKAVMKWMRDTTFVMSASLHSGSLVASYPFDNFARNSASVNQEPSLTPDDDVFKHLARVYSFKHPTMHKGHACPGSAVQFPNGITNGAAWYPLTGGMQDYNYMEHGCMELTLEISCCKFPKASELPRYWKENKEPLLSLMEEVRQGVRGVVVNDKGVGISNATLTILGRDEARFYTSAKGEFWRILRPNFYILHISAMGYQNKTLSIRVKEPVEDKWPQFINVMLTDVGSLEVSPDEPSWSNASLHVIDQTQELREHFSRSQEMRQESTTMKQNCSSDYLEQYRVAMQTSASSHTRSSYIIVVVMFASVCLLKTK